MNKPSFVQRHTVTPDSTYTLTNKTCDLFAGQWRNSDCSEFVCQSLM